MSECDYDYKFYFATEEASQTARERVMGASDDFTAATILGFDTCIDEEREYLDHIEIKPEYCHLSFTTSTSSDLNHRLIRASKDIGCEFAIVEVYNNQVGESWTHHLYRGVNVNGPTLDTLLIQYKPFEAVKHAITTSDVTALKKEISNGFDVNQKIEGISPLEIALVNKQLRPFKILLAHKADIHIKTSSDCSLLMMAIKTLEREDIDFTLLLIKMGADLSEYDKTGGSILWYSGLLGRPLQNLLRSRDALFSRPSSAYSSDYAIDLLSDALEFNDGEKITVFFKRAAQQRKDWPSIASTCLRHDYQQGFDVLLKNGFFSDEAKDDNLIDLIADTLEAKGTKCFIQLFNMALERGVMLDEHVAQFLSTLSEKHNAADAINVLLKNYPDALTYDAFTACIHSHRAENLAVLLKYNMSWQSFLDDYDMPFLHYFLDEIDAKSLEVIIASGLEFNVEYEGVSLVERSLSEDGISPAVKSLLLEYIDTLSPERQVWANIQGSRIEGLKAIWDITIHKDLQDSAGNTPLMRAVQTSDLSILKFLLAQNIDQQAKNQEGHTALCLAVAAGATEAVKALLQQGANPNDPYVIEKSAKDCNEDEDEDNDLLEMMGLGDLSLTETYESALEDAKSVTSEGSTCLMLAASKGFSEIVKLLIDAGADPWQQNSGNQDALTYSILNNQDKCMEVLLQHDDAARNIDDNAANLINSAGMACSSYAIKQLSAMGVSVNLHPEEEILTPLIAATLCSAFSHRYDAVTTLLDAGAKTGKVNDEGKTALMYACIIDNQPIIASLLAAGGYPNHIDKEAKTAHDYFIEGGAHAKDFSIDDLKPKTKLIGIYKAMVRLHSFIWKVVIPSFIVLSVVAYFSQRYALYSFYLIAGIWSARQLWTIKRAMVKPKSIKANFYEKGLMAMANAMDENKKQQVKNQEIIDSWKD